MSTPLRLLAERDVCEKLGRISRVTLWKLRRDEGAAFPTPVVLAGTRLLRWVEPDVDRWIAAQRPADAVTAEKRAEMRVLGRKGGRKRAENIAEAKAVRA